MTLNLNPTPGRMRMPSPVLPPVPAQWSSPESYNWIQEPTLQIFFPGLTNAVAKISPQYAPSERRVDQWMRVEKLRFAALQAKVMEAAARLSPRVTQFAQIKITWCPRFPNRLTGYPAHELPDEVEVTEANYTDILMTAIRDFCGGKLPTPPNRVDEDIAVIFVVRWRPEMLHTAVPAPLPPPPPPPPPPLRIYRDSVFFKEGRSCLRTPWPRPEGPISCNTSTGSN